ncbi:MAG: hypothetical protein K8L97_04055 [Anaerolineae bacterium]|nr:hypothetical protein [Anaerolineae bacterium]
MKKDNELERAQRIRDAQLSARSPGESKIKGYDWSKHAQRAQKIQRKRQEKPLLIDLYEMLPSRWKGLLVGLGIGLLPLLAAQIFLQGEWKILGWVGLLICAIIAYVIGAATQDESPTQ